jgi:hypothetical protein
VLSAVFASTLLQRNMLRWVTFACDDYDALVGRDENAATHLGGVDGRSWN